MPFNLKLIHFIFNKNINKYKLYSDYNMFMIVLKKNKKQNENKIKLSDHLHLMIIGWEGKYIGKILIHV